MELKGKGSHHSSKCSNRALGIHSMELKAYAVMNIYDSMELPESIQWN